jgi:hypothetical protein
MGSGHLLATTGARHGIGIALLVILFGVFAVLIIGGLFAIGANVAEKLSGSWPTVLIVEGVSFGITTLVAFAAGAKITVALAIAGVVSALVFLVQCSG